MHIPDPRPLRRSILSSPFPRRWLRAILSAGFAVSPVTAGAATVGHWRFENPSELGADSGPNGLNLTNNSAVAASTAVAASIVPGTALANTGSADFELNSGHHLSTTDNAAFGFQSFTIEAYIRIESIGTASTARVIVSQLNTGSGVNANGAWQFGITGTGSGLGGSRPFIQLSADGGSLYGFTPEKSLTTSAFQVNTTDYYYIAATVNFTGTGIETMFYHQNLTTGSPLLSVAGTVTYPTGITVLPTSLYNSTADFAIGASFSGGAASRHFDGLIDEVRLSDTVLLPGDLLAVPEPSAAILVTIGVLAFAGKRRR